MRATLPPAFLGAPLAHRGYHDRAAGRPENSLAACRAAVEAGYGIELDVQQSADAQAMVFHDETLDRLTARKGPVLDLTAAELGRIVLGTSDERIPTLADVLRLVAGRVPVLIEVKDRTGQFAPTDGVLESAVAAALRDYEGPVAVMSFNPHIVAALATVAPGVARGLTTDDYLAEDYPDLPPARRDALRDIRDYGPTHSSFVSHHARDLGRPVIAALKAKGAAILCWTIRAPQAEALARQIAHNITFEGYPAPIPPRQPA